MLHGLLLEYTGTLLIIASVLYTHANPIMVGLAYMAALFIADGKSEGYFNPLAGLVQYMLGRLSSGAFVKLLIVQILAAFSMVLVYKMPKIQVE
jgi:glycerol uptake facilitator-like aquaporin